MLLCTAWVEPFSVALRMIFPQIFHVTSYMIGEMQVLQLVWDSENKLYYGTLNK